MSDSDPARMPSEEETLPPNAENSLRRSGDSSSDQSCSADQPTQFQDSSNHAGSVDATVSRPKFDGYEIIDEIGRGGMGVVYKARDKKLDRTVALKMIIGGKFANEDDIGRFRIEAESAARLDHPGIVPIYEIGESDGNHFFSMKFIEGTSLSESGDKYRNDIRSAVELLIKVVDAVGHAHQRGVLHRDLKPANILLNEDGNPLVTDLGLAKRMDEESGLTQTGLAMGTPGFMAPEQAKGCKDITTAADVFSLGAILFWLHAGESPFKRETAMATLLATLEKEAPSLRSVLHDADPDLDLICQKAMHRDPARRYSSAASLAKDLRAWLAGDLISVRAPTAINVASIWVRKNLRTVLGACLTGLVCGLVVGGICLLQNMRSVAQREHTLMQLGDDQTSWVSYLTAIRHLGDEWQIMQLLIVPVVVICAFVNVLILRPQSREANIISAVTSSFAAGAVALLVGIGWPAMSDASIASGAQDIQLLASAVWFDSSLERDLAREALLQRYPGFAEMDQATRQSLLFQKIYHDQEIGILPGIWWGAGFALLFVVLPMLMTSVLSGVAWLDGFRGWHWFGCTWERSLYCVVFFTIIAFWLMDVPPALHLTLISLTVMAIALYVAVRNGPWYWRVLLSATPIICMFLLNFDMAAMRYSASSAGIASSDDQLREKAIQLDRLVARTGEPFIHYKVGIAWLSIGEEEKYQEHCRQLLSGFENAFRPEIASRLAKLSLLRPDLQQPNDLPTFHKLAKLASGFESSPLKHWFFLTRALSEQRQGNSEQAFMWNERSRQATSPHGYMIANTHLVDALAHLDKNDLAGAKRSLKLGRQWKTNTREQSFNDKHDVSWVDWRVFLILEKEVETRNSWGRNSWEQSTL